MVIFRIVLHVLAKSVTLAKYCTFTDVVGAYPIQSNDDA